MSVCTLPTLERCEYIGLHVLYRVSEKMLGTWSKLLDIEEEEDEDAALALELAVATAQLEVALGSVR